MSQLVGGIVAHMAVGVGWHGFESGGDGAFGDLPECVIFVGAVDVDGCAFGVFYACEPAGFVAGVSGGYAVGIGYAC